MMDRGYVLLADDDEAVRDPMAEVLERQGFRVKTVPNGFEATEALAATDFDVVLADINMPGNEQLQFLKERPQVRRLVPVIVITGYPSFETAVDALRAGVVDYVTKPIDPGSLLPQVEAAIRKGRALRNIREADQRVAQLSAWIETLKRELCQGESVSGRQLTPPENASVSPTGPPISEGSASERDPLGLLSAEERARLTRREREVLEWLGRGYPVQEAAALLNLSKSTVRNHLKSIFVKLQVTSQVQLLGRLAGHR